jgi:hypothetical protein
MPPVLSSATFWTTTTNERKKKRGLDMYALALYKQPSVEVDFYIGEHDGNEFHRWRKHPNLHSWMQTCGGELRRLPAGCAACGHNGVEECLAIAALAAAARSPGKKDSAGF